MAYNVVFLVILMSGRFSVQIGLLQCFSYEDITVFWVFFVSIFGCISSRVIIKISFNPCEPMADGGSNASGRV